MGRLPLFLILLSVGTLSAGLHKRQARTWGQVIPKQENELTRVFGPAHSSNELRRTKRDAATTPRTNQTDSESIKDLETHDKESRFVSRESRSEEERRATCQCPLDEDTFHFWGGSCECTSNEKYPTYSESSEEDSESSEESSNSSETTPVSNHTQTTAKLPVTTTSPKPAPKGNSKV